MLHIQPDFWDTILRFQVKQLQCALFKYRYIQEASDLNWFYFYIIFISILSIYLSIYLKPRLCWTSTRGWIGYVVTNLEEFDIVICYFCLSVSAWQEWWTAGMRNAHGQIRTTPPIWICATQSDTQKAPQVMSGWGPRSPADLWPCLRPDRNV